MDYEIDAKNKPLGRVASEAALILQGKKSANYQPEHVSTDRVLLKNWAEVKVTGDKWKDKTYYRHTGYMGHLKELSFEQKFTRDPQRTIRDVVAHMLPKNFLNARRLKNLIFINGQEK